MIEWSPEGGVFLCPRHSLLVVALNGLDLFVVLASFLLFGVALLAVGHVPHAPIIRHIRSYNMCNDPLS